MNTKKELEGDLCDINHDISTLRGELRMLYSEDIKGRLGLQEALGKLQSEKTKLLNLYHKVTQDEGIRNEEMRYKIEKLKEEVRMMGSDKETIDAIMDLVGRLDGELMVEEEEGEEV